MTVLYITLQVGLLFQSDWQGGLPGRVPFKQRHSEAGGVSQVDIRRKGISGPGISKASPCVAWLRNSQEASVPEADGAQSEALTL